MSIQAILLVLCAGLLPAAATVTTQAHYRMGEGGAPAGKQPQDVSGNNRHFISSINGGSVTIGPASPAAGSTQAYVFNGGDQGFYDAGYNAPENNVGIEAWVRIGNLAQVNRNIFGTGGNTAGLNFVFDAGQGGLRAAIAGISWVGNAYMPASTGEWVHVALVRNNGTATFYVNGQARGATTTAAPTDGSVFHLAVNSGGSLYFNGAIDELRVFTFTAGQFSPSDLLYAPPAPEPLIVAQPSSIAVPTGASATLSVYATGAATLVYQWYRNPGGIAVPDATSSTLNIGNATAANAGEYYVTVGNSLGTLTSQPASLTLLLAPTPATGPSAAQQAQITRKYGMFCHFGINTFADQEWTDGTLPASSFAPTAVNADQWVETAKAAGMRYLLLTTKHHDGFCLWDSQWTTYDVASSSVPDIDVVKLVSEACARHGIRFAVYYSLWDRHEPTYGNSAEYVTYMKRQLTELMSNYGPVAELWLDGGWQKPSSEWNIPELYHLVKTLQPDCQFTVNWTIGRLDNPDAGDVQPAQQQEGDPLRYFPCDFRTADPFMPKFPDPKIFTHNSENYYLPLEATVTLAGGNHWFFNTTDTSAKDLAFLEKTFNTATAQKNLLVLNAAPNRNGVLLPSNVTALTQLAQRLGLEPGRPFPVNLANRGTITAKSTWPAAGYEAAMACDEDPDTRWSAAAGDLSPWVQIDFGTSTRFDRVIVNEYGESSVYRCTSFILQSWNGSTWQTIHTGTTLGESRRIDLASPVVTQKLRLQVLTSSAPVSIWMLKVQDSARPDPDLSDYRIWQDQHFSLAEIASGAADPIAVPAADGIPNAMKFGLGISDVRRPYSGGTLTPVTPRAGASPLFSFFRANREASYLVQSSENLSGWTTLATNPGTPGNQASVAFPEVAGGKCFLRLSIEPGM